MSLFTFGVLILLVGCAVQGLEDSGTELGNSVADFAPSELERESPFGKKDSLYEHLMDGGHGGYGNDSLSRLEVAQPGEGVPSAHGRTRHGPDHEPLRRVQPPPRSQAALSRIVRKEQRYLPYSPSYGKATLSESFLLEEVDGMLGSEKLITRQSRDTTGSRREKNQIQVASDDAAFSSNGHPSIFAYDIAEAMDSGVTAAQRKPATVDRTAAVSRDNKESSPDIMAFDIALSKRPIFGPIDSKRFQRAMGPAMRGARQDFVQKVANQRPEQCPPVEKVQDPQDSKSSVTPSCCGTNAACVHPACFPILVPANDPVYGQYNVDCLEFVRSQPAAQSGCRLGTRIPLNSVTAYLDGSQIYGSKVSDSDRLRTKRRGLLRTNDSPICLQQNLIMIPGGVDAQGCKAAGPDRKCVDAGDLRANQHTGLVTIHSLFLRLHNQIANFIAGKRPHAPDEDIFQLTRKIVGGIIQHVYYKEMVPIIVGSKLANDPQNGLVVTKKGYCPDCYDKELDSSMQVEFAAGAYRFHTLQDNTLPVTDENGVEYPFYQHFGNPAMWYKPGIIDELLRKLPAKPAEGFDPQFSFIFQNQVFKPVTKPTGIDMLAFNIQRGRDHGIPAYIKMREVCGLAPVKTFKDLERFMSKTSADNLASIYRHVRDIDFYAGGLSERSVNKQGLVGPTFACVLTDQFQKLKNGDRFWYENDGIFTPDQLKEIKKTSMAAILCQNSQTDQIQPKPFRIPSDSNAAIPCEDILARGAMKLEPFLLGLPR